MTRNRLDRMFNALPEDRRKRVLDIIHQYEEETKGIEAARPTDNQRAKRLGDALAENERLKAEIDNVKQVEFPRKVAAVSEGWRKKLAESQAREQQLRGVMDRIADPRNIHFSGDAQVVARKALALPTDRSALDALLKQERAKERERIVIKFFFTDCPQDQMTRDSIRALEDV